MSKSTKAPQSEATAENIPAKSESAHTKKKANAQPQEKYIYVGADLPCMKSNTVFTGDIPKELDVDIVRELVIPVSQFTDFLKKKSVTTSREAMYFRKSAEYAKTLKK